MASSLSRILGVAILCFVVIYTILYQYSLPLHVQVDPHALTNSEITCNDTCHSTRLTRYCALEKPTGTEGLFSGITNEFSLTHVVLNVRHGDRSAIHSIPGATSYVKGEGYVGREDRRDAKVEDALLAMRDVKLYPLEDEHDPRWEREVGKSTKSPLVTIMSIPDR